MNFNKYILILVFLVVNNTFGQFDYLLQDEEHRLKVVDDEFLIDKDLYSFYPKNTNCDCKNFNFWGDVTFGGNQFAVINAGLLLEAQKRAELNKWYDTQRNLIREKIEDYYGESFTDYTKAVDKAFVDYGKSEHLLFSFAVGNLKSNHINTNKEYKTRNQVNLRELQHLDYRKQEILSGNIYNSIFTFSEIYGGIKLKDIKDINTLSNHWNTIKSFLDVNLSTEENSKYQSEELGNLDGRFDNFLLQLQRKFYDDQLNPGQRLFLEQLAINILKAYRANPNAFGSPNNLNINVPDGLDRAFLAPVGNQTILQNYLWAYSNRSVFDPNYYLKVLDEILVNNGFQPVYGDVNKVNFFIRTAYITLAKAQATERRNNAFNELMNSATTEDILTDLFITALGERNNAFLNARPDLRAAVVEYFKANNRSQVSHNAMNWTLNQYQDNTVFPIDETLFKSKNPPLFQDASNPYRAIKIDFIPQAVTEGITNFGNVLAELLKDNVNPEFEGSLIREIFKVNGLNINPLLSNSWFGYGFRFVETDGNCILIEFENGNNDYGTIKKRWFLDKDNDGYHAKGSSIKQQEQSPGAGWRQGISKGEDCDDNDSGKFRIISGVCFDECDLLNSAKQAYNIDGTFNQSAYSNTVVLPTELWDGWRLANISDLNLGKDFQFSNRLTGFDSSLFVKENGNQKIYIYATRGTDEGVDWIANLYNGVIVGSVSNQYVQSIENAKILDEKISQIPNSVLIFTGHSLGGGLASANALATGRNAITYNAAGVGPGTIDAFNLDIDLANTLINAIVVREELLNTYLTHIGLGADGRITTLEANESKLVDLYKKLADEQYSKARRALNDFQFAKAHGFYQNGVRYDLVKDYERLNLHAIDVISEILKCD